MIPSRRDSPSPRRKRPREEEEALRHFETHRSAPRFAQLHHPERLAHALRAQREAARRALRPLLAELSAATLLGPRRAEGPAPRVLALRQIEPLLHGLLIDNLAPSTLSAMLPTLMSALAPAATSGATLPPPSGMPGLRAVSVADPVPDERSVLADTTMRKLRLRVWAGYGSAGMVAEAGRALATMPQLSEMVRPPSVCDGTPLPLRESLPPQPEAKTLLAPLEDLADMLAARLSLPSLKEAVAPVLEPFELSLTEMPADERLQLLLLFLRRVLAFDPQSAIEHASPPEVIATAGEAALVALPLAEAPGADAAALAKERWQIQAEHIAALNALDAEATSAAVAAAEEFYSANCVLVEEGKYRCPLSGKLFRDPMFVRKHIDNKHSTKLEYEIARVLEAKYPKYFLANEKRSQRLEPLEPPRPPPPPTPPRSPEFSRGAIRVAGRSKECFNCGREGHVARDCPEHRMPPPHPAGGRPIFGGRPPPPPGAALVIDRPIINYNDLDAPDDDPLFD